MSRRSHEYRRLEENHLTPYQRFQLEQRRQREQQQLDEERELQQQHVQLLLRYNSGTLSPYNVHRSPRSPELTTPRRHLLIADSAMVDAFPQTPNALETPDHLHPVSSGQTETTTTYVEYGNPPVTPPGRKRRKKKVRKRRPKTRPAAPTAAPEASVPPVSDPVVKTVSPRVGDLENQNELHNEKRLFSFLFSKKVPPVTAPEERTAYPWKTANPLSRMMFYWLLPTMMKGYKRTLQPDDLWYLPDNLTVEDMHRRYLERFNRHVEKSKANYLKKHGNTDDWTWSPFLIPWCIFLTFKWQYTMSCIFLGLSFCCQALSPLLTRRLIDFVENRYFGLEPSLNPGLGYTLGSVVLIFINGLLLNHYFHNAMVTGAQAKSILTKELLLKSFKLSARSKFKFPIGRITSLMSTDLARIDLAIGFQPLVICFPIPVIIAVVLLLTNIGVASLAGIGLFIVSLVVCVLLTTKLFVTRETVVKHTDERISLMREVLNNLKIIKFYAWELAYKLNITKVREREMKYLFTIKVLRNFITAYAVTLPTLTSMVSFVTMWASGRMRSPGEVFSSLSLFSILAQAIMLLPIALATGADAFIGFKRCQSYLSASEFDDELKEKLDPSANKYYIAGDTNSEFEFKNDDTYSDDVSFEKNDDVVLKVEHGDFIWEAFHDDVGDGDSLWDNVSNDNLPEKKKKSDKPSNVYSVDKRYNDSRSSNDTYFEPVDTASSSALAETTFPGLLDINLSIRKGEFVVITGVIGSGKSSLLAAMAGFMKLSNPRVGSIDIKEDLLLCLVPWIQNATVRENILFGQPFDAQRYKQIIDACALKEDFAMLPAKDHTEIGERGITLSGGQKARINLARAVYANADILLFDDVLSAVDSRVGKHIINSLFYGLMREKTRVLATHQLSLVENADKIVFLNGDGTIDVGGFSELRQRNSGFRRLTDFNKESTGSEEIDEDEYVRDVIHQNVLSTTVTRNEYDATEEENAANTFAGRTLADEERSTNAIGWDIYKKYINLGSGVFGYAAAPIFLFLMAIATFCQLFTNTWLSWWTEKRYHYLSDHFYVAFYVMFACLTVVFTAIEFTMLAYMNNRSAQLLNVQAVAKILHAPMSFMDTNPMGRILNRFTKDTDSLDNEIGEQLRLFLFPLAMIIGIVILCITYLPWFAIAVPFLAFAFTFISNFYSGSSREIKRLEALQRSVVYNNFNETLSGMNTIKAYKVEDNFIKRNDHYLNKMNEAYYLAIANQRWLSVHLDIVASAFALIICMMCITEQFNISASSTGLLLSYVIQIVGLLSLTIRSMTLVESEMNSVERLHAYAFNLPQEAAYEKPEFAPPPEWPTSGYIEFKDVSFKYRPSLPLVLKGLSFSVYPGEKVGICGRTGAGKSSIMCALYRLNEIEKGSIAIDGLDIGQMGLKDLRSNLSIIPQDPVLFQGSIRKNLDPFGQYNDDVLWDSLRRAGLVDELAVYKMRNLKLDHKNGVGYDDLPKFHLDQMVEDDGNNYSLGEKQLLALARALVRNSKILILDEATSSVDYETDAKIQDTIVEEFDQCTILCIAHRLKTILQYDRILVMDDGEIVEKGTPWELFTQNGVFTKMCQKASISAQDF